MILIAPSILAGDFLRLGEAVRRAEEGGADRLHIDVMDGRFVPNITLGQPVVKAIRAATTMLLEVHLMIVEPERYVADFAAAGADLITFHAEVSPHMYRTIEQIHSSGKLAGVAVNPGTPWGVLREVMGIADLVLVMTVNPGAGGQKFIGAMTAKIRSVREEINSIGRPLELEVDGGINEGTAPLVVAAGARVLVAGTSVFGATDGVLPAIARLRRAALERLDPADTRKQ